MEKSNIVRATLCLILVTLCNHISDVESSCEPVDKSKPSCSCKTEKGDILDLEKIFDDMKGAQEPLFSKNIKDYKYSFQPCRPFSCGDSAEASACQTKIDPTDSVSYTIGRESTAQFSGSIYSDSLMLAYEGEEDPQTKKKRHTYIALKCDEGLTSFTGIGENETLVYNFTLTTPRVCPPAQHKKGLSTGSILCILLLVCVVVYLVGGVLFLRFVRGAHGIEMIPNLEFWKDLPSLIKDGFLFASRGCKSDPTYNQI